MDDMVMKVYQERFYGLGRPNFLTSCCTNIYIFLLLQFILVLRMKITNRECKRGMAKLNFVCESARNWAPNWQNDARFCMVGTNVIYFSETTFFELTLFGWHEVKLHHPMFLSPEILTFHVSCFSVAIAT